MTRGHISLLFSISLLLPFFLPPVSTFHFLLPFPLFFLPIPHLASFLPHPSLPPSLFLIFSIYPLLPAILASGLSHQQDRAGLLSLPTPRKADAEVKLGWASVMLAGRWRGWGQRKPLPLLF